MRVGMLPNMFVNKLGYSVSGNSPLHMFVFSEKPVLCPWRAPIQSSCPRQNLASGFHIDRLFSSQAAEDREEALHSIIGSTETVQGTASAMSGLGRLSLCLALGGGF